jgi:hypothetical protein
MLDREHEPDSEVPILGQPALTDSRSVTRVNECYRDVTTATTLERIGQPLEP